MGAGGQVEDGLKGRGKPGTLESFGMFFQNIYARDLPQTYATELSRYRHRCVWMNKPSWEIQLELLANIHSITSNRFLIHKI